ncbi:putative serine esterase-domain-containing protein [Radiomyces spectabilis]|uniref:putative serine esterase-domain-containing protein n=1 Tax=Radiomyces spectabilis TaxID=64574 RepID=UPI00221F68E5|nr:putative serine esterase-domain-containing protein [Radiomyces spectabilis]KAI8391494.1 putative serine esterase-domain-containing protein [Radiomyces spectabilis]
MTNKDISLIVLQHGLWGNHDHMKFLEKQIRHAYKDKDHLSILNSDVNESKYTYDGIDICGRRLVIKIHEHIDELKSKGLRVTKVGMVGYSMGGLILRFAIGLLGKEGFFRTVEPVFFVTFATPHLGSRLPAGSLFDRLFNFICGSMVSRSGDQLQLVDTYEDQQPLLSILADPEREFHKTLALFKARRTYANVDNDRTVPYWTAALSDINYFESMDDLEISLDNAYPSVVTAFDRRDPTMFKKTGARFRWNTVLKIVFYILSPVLVILFILLVLSYIGYQGMISRYRVARILAAQKKDASTPLLQTHVKQKKDYRRRSSGFSDEADRMMEGNVLADALDAVNLPDRNDDHNVHHTSNHPAGA